MKLLVEIPDYRYRAIKDIDVTQKPYTINERSAITVIKNGQPLPEPYKVESEEDNMKLIDGNIQALSITEYILKNKEKFIEILQKCDNDFLFALMMEYFDAQPGYDITLAQKTESEGEEC